MGAAMSQDGGWHYFFLEETRRKARKMVDNNSNHNYIQLTRHLISIEE